jgi:hypothetical protein
MTCEQVKNTAQAELSQLAEALLEKIKKFQDDHPDEWQAINEQIYSISDLNLGDLESLLKNFCDVAG